MRTRTSAIYGALAGVLAIMALGTQGCGRNDLYAMSEHYELVGDRKVFAGGGCSAAVSRGIGDRSGSSGSSGGRVDADFTVAETSDGEGLTVIVSSGERELARREYHEGFLESGKVDRFQVTTLSGRRFELAYWGGPECDTSHLPRE